MGMKHNVLMLKKSVRLMFIKFYSSPRAAIIDCGHWNHEGGST